MRTTRGFGFGRCFQRPEETGFNPEQKQDILRIVQIALKDAELKKELYRLKNNNELNIFKSQVLPQMIVFVFMAFLFGLVIGSVLL